MRRNEKKRLLILTVALLGFIFVLTSFSDKSHKAEVKDELPISTESKKEHHFIQEKVPSHLDIITANKTYINSVDSTRINRLFRIIQDKEKNFRPITKGLKLISFEDIVLQKGESEYKILLQLKNGRVEATDYLINYLKTQSDSNSFGYSRTKIYPEKITAPKEKPVIVMAANAAYYGPLQTTVFKVHEYFPDYHLIIYDLGLEPDQLKKTKEKCKCEVRTFDQDSKYSKIVSHVAHLKKFSWKPIIIQEVLNDFDTVMYVDTSIRFKSNEIKPVIDSVRNVGLLTQYIYLRLLHYTNPLMFEWFEESSESYKEFFTIEANILFFYNNFLTKLIMKAWIACALEESCIAPSGLQTHRFDQDALTIVCSYFFGNPTEAMKFLPAYSFTKEESYFFDIRRYEAMAYF